MWIIYSSRVNIDEFLIPRFSVMLLPGHCLDPWKEQGKGWWGGKVAWGKTISIDCEVEKVRRLRGRNRFPSGATILYPRKLGRRIKKEWGGSRFYSALRKTQNSYDALVLILYHHNLCLLNPSFTAELLSEILQHIIKYIRVTHCIYFL